MTSCPRCTGELAQFEDDLGTATRVMTGEGEAICGPCGTDEAVRDALTLAPIPPGEWPVQVLLTWDDVTPRSA